MRRSEILGSQVQAPDKATGLEQSHEVIGFGWRIVAFSGASTLDRQARKTDLLAPFLAALDACEHLAIRLSYEPSASRLEAAIDIRVGPGGRTRLEARKAALQPLLGALLCAQMPGFVIQPMPEAPTRVGAKTPYVVSVTPVGRLITGGAANRSKPKPQPVVPSQGSLLLPSAPLSADRLAGAAELLRARGRAASLILSMRLRRFDAVTMRDLHDARDAIQVEARRPSTEVEALRQVAETIGDDVVMTELLREGGGLTLALAVEADEPVEDELRNMLCYAVFGAPSGHRTGQAALDLSTTWPTAMALPRLHIGLAAAAAVGLRNAAPIYTPPAHGTLLGRTADGRDVRLTERDRDRHVYVLGATGTGKSTMLLGMIRADMMAGKGVVLIDPHGDLFEQARREIPQERSDDVVLGHLGDTGQLSFTLNALENPGSEEDVWSNAITGELLRLFKRTLWPDVRDAFGPMFEMYYRNALLLLLESDKADATLLDFPLIFQDDKLRRSLVEKCRNESVRAFWTNTAERVSWNEIALENVAPYILCKFAPFVSNRHLKRVLGARRSSIDFGDIIRRQRICLINLAKGIVGSAPASLIGGLLSMRLVTAAQNQAQLDPAARKKVSVYLDEVQSFATEHLAEGLEECRKYGLQMVLANQSLGQVDGRGFRADIGKSVLANCASLLSFRLGVPDASALASYFEPLACADDLVYLPDYTAVARLIADGRPVRPLELKTVPPVEGAGR